MAIKKKAGPIDTPGSARYVLDGRVVTMNNSFTVIEQGRVYINGAKIVAARDAQAEAPSGFADAPVLKTRGTIFPGLIELHNHLSYNALPMWQVPRIFAHRGQWSDHPDKRRLISQPMSVLASIGGMIEALVRYVEAKCLVAGVTTSQGLKLVAKPGIEHYYRGVIRNVEQTDDPELPEAGSRIPDVDKAADFLKRLKKAEGKSLILHLAEGIGPLARKHFLALQIGGESWAITPALVAIHGAGLQDTDFDVLAEKGGGLVWSPLSNLLLYGGTADVKRAKKAGLPLALGSDWSPSGSKNLLSELKVAWAYSEMIGGVFTPRELVAMATINPARMVKWGSALGSIASEKRADLLVVLGRSGDPYERLLKAREDDIQLVIINGVPRFGGAALMDKAVAVLGSPAPKLESRKLNGHATKFNFVQETADPLVAPVTLAEAEKRLRDGLRDLPELASGLADPVVASALLGVLGAAATDEPIMRWTLELENEPHVMGARGAETSRPLLPWDSVSAGAQFGAEAEALNASTAANLVSMTLDPFTVVDDAQYFERLARQINLPEPLKRELPKLHRAPIPSAPSGAAIHVPPVTDSPDQLTPTMPRSLKELMALHDMLTDEERIDLVRKLRAVLEGVYVHLPLKRAAHAVDPLQRLRLLEYSLSQTHRAAKMADLAFHQALLEIFTELRDLHTLYMLPPPFSDLTAFLPFLVEICYEAGDEALPQFLVTKVAESLEHPTFRTGVRLLYWNGKTIENAVRDNADRQAGSNLAARFARGLAGLTIRPLVRVLPPDEEWVQLVYRALDGRVLEIRLPWQLRTPSGVVSFEVPPLSRQSVSAASSAPSKGVTRGRKRGPDMAALASFGVDMQLEVVNETRRDLYAKAPVRRRARPKPVAGEDVPTTMAGLLRARLVEAARGTFGHLRIFGFSVADADAFVAEVVRILKLLPRDGLILDVRNNPGGLIWAAEQLLQLFTDRKIQPEPAQFINTPRTLELVRRNAPSANLDLSPWVESMSQAVITAAVHSEGFPITPVERANRIGRVYRGPVVLVTDALAYSATDILAAGFKDHEIGPILGVDANTGAGGANVWSYPLLQKLLSPEGEPESLPGGCDLRVAVRRTLRVGAHAGVPVEDLGIEPDHRHFLTPRDVLENNDDLMAHAAALLSKPRRRRA